ncbi:MAG: flagellar biosynthetic protein FliO [Acidobacteriota bacterium]
MEVAASAGIVALLALAAGALWVMARGRSGLPFGRNRGRGPAELVQRLPLTPQHSLHLIRVAGEALWVVTYPNGAVVGHRKSFADWVAEAGVAQGEGSR